MILRIARFSKNQVIGLTTIITSFAIAYLIAFSNILLYQRRFYSSDEGIYSDEIKTEFLHKENKEEEKKLSSINKNENHIILIPPTPDPLPGRHFSYSYSNPNNNESLSLSSPTTIDPNKNQNDALLARIRNGKCNITSQLLLIMSSDENYNSPWKIQSLDISGRNKTFGGDEYYVSYFDDEMMKPGDDKKIGKQKQPTAVAWIHDNNDGTYTLDFVTTPFINTKVKKSKTRNNNNGSIQIDLQYSCGVGSLPVGEKATWSSGGSLQVRYQVNVPKAPPMKKFASPNQQSELIDLGKYEEVNVFGDSNMQQFSKTKWNMNYGVNVNSQLLPYFANKRWLPRIRTMLNQSLTRVITTTNNNTTINTIDEEKKKKKISLVVHSSTWDLMQGEERRDFKKHKNAVEKLINTIREEFPQVDLYWYSALAVHVHAAYQTKWWELKSIYYFSTSRATYLYNLQKDIMNRLNIPILDIFEASYLCSHLTLSRDARHYQEYFHSMTTNWFYPNRTQQ